MATAPLILALDQGTTSSRSVVFDASANIIASDQKEFTQHYPANGWVEHDPEEIWDTIKTTARAVIEQTQSQGKIAAIGITNQRETVIIWDRATGRAIAPAIVWQDRRTADICKSLASAGHEAQVTEKTGLLLDPYFSASKVGWLLDNVDGARGRAERGDLAFGTVDCFLLWRLTGGRVHATDETNASRTSLYSIHTGDWDDELLALFNVPREVLPEVKPSAARFGETEEALFGAAIPVCGIAGDQQSAAFGQLCTQPGMSKATYGTGCFLLMNTGEKAVQSSNRLLTTRACRVGAAPQYALEGSIFIAGAVAQWLRDELQVIATSPESEAIASRLPSNDGVYLVPAFAGLGAPHWDSEARGAIYGLTRQSGRDHLIRAALESVAYQTHDLLAALAADGATPELIRVDGGMSANNWLLQFISDMTDTKLQRPPNVETTALGVAYLAGLEIGVWQNIEALDKMNRPYQTFTPAMAVPDRRQLLKDWNIAVKTTLFHADLKRS